MHILNFVLEYFYDHYTSVQILSESINKYAVEVLITK